MVGGSFDRVSVQETWNCGVLKEVLLLDFYMYLEAKKNGSPACTGLASMTRRLYCNRTKLRYISKMKNEKM